MVEVFTRDNLILAASFMAAIGTVLAAMVALLIARRERVNKSHYDMQSGMAALSMLRAAYEDRIADLTDRLTTTEERWAEVNHLVLDAQRVQSVGIPSAAQALQPQTNVFLASLGIDLTDIEVDPKLVFVLTPFSDREAEVYAAIGAACGRLGLYASRGDEEFVDGPILPHIVRQILRSRMVVGNISSRNPNVFYELGIAQSLGKPTLLVSKGRHRPVPFDVRSRRVIFFDDNADLEQALQLELARWIVDPPKN